MKKLYRSTYILLGLLLICSSAVAQFSTCDTNLINAHLNPAGYNRVYVPTQPCSMYFYSTTPKNGIDAHRDAANLNVPQVIIEDVAENSDLSGALFAQGIYGIPNSGSSVWLGITDSSTTFTWRVIATGGSVSYFNWAAGDPNNLAPGCYNGVTGCSLCTGTNAYWCTYGEDCAIMNAAGQWKDNACLGTTTGNPGGPAILRTVILELNTCPVLAKPHDTISCPGNPLNLSASVISGGTAPYTYTWNPGGLTGPSVSVSPSTATTYTVQASDHYLCKTDSTFTVSISTLTAPTINASNTCKGVNTNVSLSSVSGTATYNWSFDAGSSVVSGTGGGPYSINWSTGGTKAISVTVTQNGCTATATTNINVDSADAAFTIAPTSACPSQDVAITVTNVSATANYAWNFNGGNVTSGTTSGPYAVNWSSTGTQTVDLTVTDHGCTANASHTLSVSNAITVAFTLSPSINACTGQPVSVTLTGPASATATYTWDFYTATVISGSGAGPYSVSWSSQGSQNVDLTVTDGGCTGVAATQSINITNSVTADAGADVQLCPSVAGSLGAPATAGYTYSWSPATGLDNPLLANPTITLSNPTGAIVTATYVVTASSGSCSGTDTVIVTVYPDIDSNFTVSSHTACVGSDVTFTYSGTVSPTAIYNWNFGGGNVTSGSGAGPYTVNWSSTGPVNVILDVTDNGCTVEHTDVITVGTSSVTADAGPDQTICSGGSVQLGVAPTAGVTYTWSPNIFISNPNISNPTFSETNTSSFADVTDYILVASDGGCPDTAYVTITTEPALPINFTFSGPVTLCSGQSVTIFDTITDQVNYIWSTGATSSSITTSTSGIYSVTAHDAAGCEYISDPSVQVYAYTSPTVALVTQMNESCRDAADGSLTVDASNGNPTYAYSWSTSENGSTISNLAPGDYTVTVYDHYGCVDSATFTVDPAPYIGVNIDSMKNVSCYLRGNGGIYAGVTGGNLPVSYLWSTGSTASSITSLVADTFSVTITDARGCVADTSVIITQPGPIAFTPTSPLYIEYGGSEQIDITITPSLNYIYNWTPSTGLSCTNCPSPIANPLITTRYILTINDPTADCSAIDTIVLYVDGSKKFYIPNTFTPNGDGTNDVFTAYARGPVKFFEITIFDRWGEKVFDTNDIETGWDGKYHGVYVSDGDYVYNATITFLDGQTLSTRGSVTVLK